jgi:predicted nucleotidyltransferase
LSLISRVLEPLVDKILVAFVYGSIAKGADTAGSDIDIMIVSDDLSYPEIISIFAAAEARLGRLVNPTLYHPDELCRKLAEENSFVQRVTQQEKIFLIGSQNDIPKP